MTADDAIVAMIDALNDLGIGYMAVGSLSTNFYGIPRMTQDADFVLQIEPKQIQPLTQQIAPKLQLDPQSSFESVTATTRFVVQAAHSAFTIELFILSDDPHDQTRFARRRQIKLLGRPCYVPAVEDVIITKLRWSQHGRREKDISDLRNVIAVQADSIDWHEVNRWCDEHGTRQLAEQLRSQAP